MESLTTAMRWRHQSHDGMVFPLSPLLSEARARMNDKGDSKGLYAAFATEDGIDSNIRSAVDHFDNKAFRVKTFSKEEDSEDYRYYQILRDNCSISHCKRLILSSDSSPVTKVYAAMALIQGGAPLTNSLDTDEERTTREEALEELAIQLMNDKTLVEIQTGCITSHSSVGDEICNLGLLMLHGERRKRLAMTLLQRFVDGTFVQPDFSKPVLQSALDLLDGQLRRSSSFETLDTASQEELTALISRSKEALQTLGKRNVVAVLPR